MSKVDAILTSVISRADNVMTFSVKMCFCSSKLMSEINFGSYNGFKNHFRACLTSPALDPKSNQLHTWILCLRGCVIQRRNGENARKNVFEWTFQFLGYKPNQQYWKARMAGECNYFDMLFIKWIYLNFYALFCLIQGNPRAERSKS